MYCNLEGLRFQLDRAKRWGPQDVEGDSGKGVCEYRNGLPLPHLYREKRLALGEITSIEEVC